MEILAGVVVLIFFLYPPLWFTLFLKVFDLVDWCSPSARRDKKARALLAAAARERSELEAEERRLESAHRNEAATKQERIAAAKRLTIHSEDERYGASHKALREAWKEIIQQKEVECREHECIMPSRSIAQSAPWDAWDLAHDHERGGDFYVGPAHKKCNQAEALRRGVTWEGAPDLATLLLSAGSDPLHGLVRSRASDRDPWATPFMDDPEEETWSSQGSSMEEPPF